MHYKEIFDIEFNEIYMLSYMWIYLKKKIKQERHLMDS